MKEDLIVYDTDDMMRILKIGRTTLNTLLVSGELPAKKVGRQWRITKEELEKWMSI